MLVARQFPVDFFDQRIHGLLNWAGIIALIPLLPPPMH
jgi:hypothetical protein